MSLKDMGITVRKGSPLDPHGTRDAEKAVIEAAQTLVYVVYGSSAKAMTEYSKEEQGLVAAVYALDDLEATEEEKEL